MSVTDSIIVHRPLDDRRHSTQRWQSKRRRYLRRYIDKRKNDDKRPDQQTHRPTGDARTDWSQTSDRPH